MNYYEQFYDDLEFDDYDDDPYHRRGRLPREPFMDWDDPDPFYRDRGHRGPPEGRERPHHLPPRDRGRPDPHDVDYYERTDHRRPHPDDWKEHDDRGVPEFSRGRGQFDRERGQFDRGRGQFDRGRGRGRGADRGRGAGGDSGRGSSAGRAQRGGPARGAKRGGGKYGMTFVKASTDAAPDTENKSLYEKETTESDTPAPPGTSDTIRFDYKTYNSQRTETEKEVEQALKAYSCTLGFGYGYGPRTDLGEGMPEGGWVGQEGEAMDTTQAEPATTTAASTNSPVTSPTTASPNPSNPSIQPTIVKKAVVKTGFNFVKARSEFKSTDVAFHEVPKPDLQPKQNHISVNMGNKRIGLGFGTSVKEAAPSTGQNTTLAKFQFKVKDGCNPFFDRRFKQLHDIVKVKSSLPNKNGIEIMHMSVDKIKLSLNDDTRLGGRTPSGHPIYVCRLEIDGVHVADGQAMAKKAAKHEAFKNAVQVLMADDLTVKEVAGVLELKRNGPEFKTPQLPGVGPSPQAKKPGTAPVSQYAGMSKKDALASLTQPSTTTTAANTTPDPTITTSQAASTMTYVKPKIVFHAGKSSPHPLADKALQFKAPLPTTGATSQNSNNPQWGVANPAAMAMKLLNSVRESVECNNSELQSMDTTPPKSTDIPPSQKQVTSSTTSVTTSPGTSTVTSPASQKTLAHSPLSTTTTSSTGPSTTLKSTAPSSTGPSTTLKSTAPSSTGPSTTLKSTAPKTTSPAKSSTPTPTTSTSPSSAKSTTSTSSHKATTPSPTSSTKSSSSTSSLNATAPSPTSSAQSANQDTSPSASSSKSSTSSSSQKSTTPSPTSSSKSSTSSSFSSVSFVKSSTPDSSEKPPSNQQHKSATHQNVSSSYSAKSPSPMHQQHKSSSSSYNSSSKHKTASSVSPSTSSGFTPYRPPGNRLQSSVTLVNNSAKKRPSTGGNDGLVVKRSRNNAMNSLEDLSQFIIIDPTGMSGESADITILHNSANFNRVVLKVEYEACTGGMNCSVIISDYVVATAFGENKEQSKLNAGKEALDELREMCYTILVKSSVDNDAAGLTKEQLMSDIQKSGEMLPNSNIGNMLLRKMGWAGGGVGKKGQGISEPVKAEMVIGREGLGLKESKGIGKEFNRKVRKILEDYIKSNEQKDLHFSSELAKEERAIVHSIGQAMGLKTQSKGKDANRYLIISRKRSAQQLLQHVIESGGSTTKYEVLPPKSADFDCRRKEDITYGHGKQ